MSNMPVSATELGLQIPDIIPSRGHRVSTGPRAQFAGLLFLATTLAACGGNASADVTQSNDPVRTGSPTPTLVNQESQSPITTAEVTATPEASPTPELTPKPTESADSVPTAIEALDVVINQSDNDIKSVEIKKIKDAMKNLWKNHQDSILGIDFSGSYVPFADPNEKDPAKRVPSQEYMLKDANEIENGRDGVSGAELIDSKRQASVQTVADFAVIYKNTTDSSLRADLIPLLDWTYDDGALVQGKGKKQIDNTRASMKWDISALLPWYK